MHSTISSIHRSWTSQFERLFRFGTPFVIKEQIDATHRQALLEGSGRGEMSLDLQFVKHRHTEIFLTQLRTRQKPDVFIILEMSERERKMIYFWSTPLSLSLTKA